jgi:hypothetical protein
MLCELEYQDQIIRDLPVQDVTWAVAVAREVGVARVFVPAEDPAFASAQINGVYDGKYIKRDGGSRLTIRHEALGVWRGIVTETQFSQKGVTLFAHEHAILTAIRPVRRRTYTSTTAGVIVQAALRDALAGVGRSGIVPGSFVASAPLITSYAFANQALSNVLNDLMTATGQEWEITDDGRFNWLPSVGSHYPTLLVEGADVVDVTFSSSIMGQVRRMRGELPSSASYQSNEPVMVDANEGTDLSFWPAERLVTLSSADRATARRELERALTTARQPKITIGCKLHRDHWAVRQGDRIDILIRTAGFRHRTLHCRVFTRRYSEGAEWLDLRLEVIPTVNPAALGAGTPTTSAGGGGGGRAGSNPIRDLVTEQAEQGNVRFEQNRETGTTGHSHRELSDVILSGVTRLQAVQAIDETVTMSGRYMFEYADIKQFYSQGTLKVAQLPEDDGSVTLFTCFEMERTRFGMLIPVDDPEWFLPHAERWERFTSRLDERFIRWTQKPYHAVRLDSSDASGRALILADVRDGVSYQMPRFGEGLRRWDD